MLGWILGALAIGAVCCTAGSSKKNKEIKHYKKENNYYKQQNHTLNNKVNQLTRERNYYKLTMTNNSRLLHDYDVVNRYAKNLGFKGAVPFFFNLAKYHDSRFEHFARFLDKVRHVRIDIAHHGTIYNIDQGFLDKLHACVRVCDAHRALPYGGRLCIPQR